MAFPSPSNSQTRASTSAKRVLYLLVACILVFLMWSYSAGDHPPHNLESTQPPPLADDLKSLPVHGATSIFSVLPEAFEPISTITSAEEDVIVQEVKTKIVVETAHAAL